MHLSFVSTYWWAVLAVMATIMVGYILVAGRGAEGGLGARARHGWEKWRGLSRQVGEVQARILLTIFYFTIAAPFGLYRTFLSDPLGRKRGAGPAWRARTSRDRTLQDARRQF